MRGPGLIHLWGPSPTVARKKWKNVNQIALNRKWRYWHSKCTINKNSKSLLECSTITALVAAFNAKAFNDTELLKSYLAGGNRIINFCGQTSRKRKGGSSQYGWGGAISVIFGSQVSYRFSTVIRKKHTSQHCCNKTMDDKMALYHERCFPNCKKTWWKVAYAKIS